MKKEDISAIISSIDEKYTDEATEFAIAQDRKTGGRYRRASGEDQAAGRKYFGARKYRKQRFSRSAAAACLALIAAAGAVTFAFAAETREYSNAVSFFEESGLSAEGLSRADIKAVYRDITERTFTYGRTAEVIIKAAGAGSSREMSGAVPGYEILCSDPSPEELEALWDNNMNTHTALTASPDGTDFRIDAKYVYDQQRGFQVLDRSILQRVRNEEVLWTAEFKDFYIESVAEVKDGIAVWGSNELLSSDDVPSPWVALLDDDGNMLWHKVLDHGFGDEYVASVLDGADGGLAVISRGDLKYLCLSSLDLDGNELGFHKTEVGNLGIRNAVRLGDGYLVQLMNTMTHDTACLYKMNRDGLVTDSFSYEANDCEYFITDMAEFGNSVYLSAYAVPPQQESGGRHEIANILSYVFTKEENGGDFNIADEELTGLVRENYTAVLLVCSPESGVPKTFYSVPGALGGGLFADGGGLLEWEAQSIVSTFFSPATSSFTIGGSCKVYRYTFDADGSLVKQEDTGKTASYRR